VSPGAPTKKPRVVRTPTVLQMEQVECGAASLAMVLAHYGRWVTLEELRQACGVSRDGSKASNLLKAGRAYGLTAKGFKKDPERLAELPWPVILHWNFNHFLVLEGVAEGRAFLNDPVEGRRTVSLQELSEAFTGVALAFEPGPDFKPGGAPPRFLALLWSRLTGSREALAYIALASAILAVLGVILPVFSRVFVDDVLVGRQERWLAPLLIGMALTALVRMAVTGLQQRALLKLEAKLSIAWSSRFFWHVLRLPMSFFGQRHPGEVANRIAANDRVARLLSGELANTLIELGMMVFFGLVMFAYDPLLAAVAVALALPNLLLLRMAQERQAQASQRQLAVTGRFGAITAGMIQAIETLKASGLEGRAFERWAGNQAAVLSVRQELGAQAMLLDAAPGLLRALSVAAVLGIGGVRVMEGALTLGGLVAFQTLAESFAQPIRRFVSLNGLFQSVRADLGRLEDALKNRADPASAAPARLADDEPTPGLQGEVRLQGISFGYSPLDPPLIEGFDLTLAPGARVALVGGSGSGKSTIGRLICGLQQPWAGEIRFDGAPMLQMSAAARAQSIAYVDQDIFLFEGTVRENLTLWDRGVPDETLTLALADAAILDDISSRPGQLDCGIAEGGTNFSGGQRQRLEIARALAVNPSILVLDEATAALDSATEKEIDDNLRRRGCTCIIIAHRLSTIRDCDEIVVLSRGKVVERGTHDELAARGGEYAALIAAA
jgi:NHLM bacteriocin system ABC transporter peptidase/ATP-binding protein